MIQEDKYQNALRSLNSILTRARWMSCEANNPELAELLDAVEILPKYIGQPEDATDDFQTAIESISRQFPTCSHVVEEFNDACACVW